jgi:hypothetical protein
LRKIERAGIDDIGLKPQEINANANITENNSSVNTSGITYRDIAKEAHMSLGDISAIVHSFSLCISVLTQPHDYCCFLF